MIMLEHTRLDITLGTTRSLTVWGLWKTDIEKQVTGTNRSAIPLDGLTLLEFWESGKRAKKIRHVLIYRI